MEPPRSRPSPRPPRPRATANGFPFTTPAPPPPPCAVWHEVADYSASLREAPETGELEDAGRLVHLCGIPGDDGRRVTPRGLEDRVEPPVAPPGRRRRMR